MEIYSFLASVKWLTVGEIILLIMNLMLLVRYAVPIQKSYRWFDFVPSAGLLIAIISLLSGNTTPPAIAIYTVSLVIFLCTVRRLFRPTGRIRLPKYRFVRAIFCICGAIPLIVALQHAGELRYNPTSDLSKLSYAKAFVQLNQRLTKEYPFGEWKHVNWQALQNKYEPLFKQIDQDKNKEAYYKTLKDYLSSFRDGHVRIVNDKVYENQVFKNEVGGGFGISTVQLDNGKVLVSLVLENSPAQKNGIKLGSEIVTWDGKDVKEAFASTTWSDGSIATDEAKRINQGRFMARSPIGKEIQVGFQNVGDKKISKVMLKAYDDQYETLKQTKVKFTQADLDGPSIEGKALDNGYGYIKITHFAPSDTAPNPEKLLEDQLKKLQTKPLNGLIIDLRNNPGGVDALAANLTGHFVKKKTIYEYASYYNRYTSKFEINHSDYLTVQPTKPSYTGKIAILINSRTGSSGEGMPLILKGLPNVTIIGFTSTAGSFGIVTSPITFNMPEGYFVEFPDGRSLNAKQVIQGDADYTGQGGAVPDIKIPLNEETFKAMYVEGQDVELNYALAALQK
ncbi:PDZ domain-containing protein [Paenibacillus sp. SYP-B3998]|uniref:PDZ domain-containing protein n=1 Tax=Paenibacillus sp. SYP-B3998 TaxID=2678564 RepID=A0A6G3ZRT1_9BACL|nr:S41 family peptidase [Paenibacillus sp. SYP-B3998]NEW04825.1 PDZ domain-containing protein [Paenibacillus sp. SYP-B3998]